MNMTIRLIGSVVGSLLLVHATVVRAQDWPQWRGVDRDGKATGFTAPETWPKELKQEWKVEVGDGVATPAFADGKLFVFTRQGANEILRCLDAATGKALWEQTYPAEPVGGPARGFPGPRCSPTFADGKVFVLGVEGVLSCYDATSGKALWQHEEYKGEVPGFATSSSPIVVDELCIAQLGDSNGGGFVAYETATGKEAWKWLGNGPAYASPVLSVLGETQVIIAPTINSLVALDATTGELLWKFAYAQGRYNAATPIVAADTLFVAGPRRGMTAMKLAMQEGKVAMQELWTNADDSVQFNTPILKDDHLYGLSTSNRVFCIDAKSGATAWSAPLVESAGGGEAEPPQEGRRGRRGGRGGRGGGGGYGSIVDAGAVLFALTPAGDLVVFGPSNEKLTRIASYKVASEKTYAYPVIAGKHIFTKDADSITSWSIE